MSLISVYAKNSAPAKLPNSSADFYFPFLFNIIFCFLLYFLLLHNINLYVVLLLLLQPSESDICLACFSVSCIASFRWCCLPLVFVCFVSAYKNRRERRQQHWRLEILKQVGSFSPLSHVHILIFVWLPGHCFTWAHLFQCPHALFSFILLCGFLQ